MCQSSRDDVLESTWLETNFQQLLLLVGILTASFRAHVNIVSLLTYLLTYLYTDTLH